MLAEFITYQRFGIVWRPFRVPFHTGPNANRCCLGNTASGGVTYAKTSNRISPRLSFVAITSPSATVNVQPHSHS